VRAIYPEVVVPLADECVDEPHTITPTPFDRQ
jgi:hypothetical protein